MAVVTTLGGTIARMAPQLALLALAVAAVVFFGQRFGLFGEEIRLSPPPPPACSRGRTAASYCPRCLTGIVPDRSVDGRRMIHHRTPSMS